jgi:hypothetical protein
MSSLRELLNNNPDLTKDYGPDDHGVVFAWLYTMHPTFRAWLFDAYITEYQQKLLEQGDVNPISIYLPHDESMFDGWNTFWTRPGPTSLSI